MQMRKFGSNKYPISQSNCPPLIKKLNADSVYLANSYHPSSNRPPSATNRKSAESPTKSFNFNVQGQAAYSGAGTRSGMNVEKLQNSTNQSNKSEAQKTEEDERYRYLLKHGIVRKVEEEDKIIFAELPQIPGVLVVYRKPSERSANPERLNLDRRELTHLPLLEGEERLRLLNLQHNYINKIENLVSLPNLIFLDLYNNEIKEISHLHTVPTLRVLMLGKNYIERIRNLQSLVKLDVLDLHSNKISKIENLNHLSELRVLNLANNLITTVENLSGLISLTELNLRRNLIECVHNLNSCPKLQRIFLSNNRIDKMENINSLKDAFQLTELALDGNPIAGNTSLYIKFCLECCPNLKHLDLKKVTSEMKEGIRVGGKQMEGTPSRKSVKDSPSHLSTNYLESTPNSLVGGGMGRGTPSTEAKSPDKTKGPLTPQTENSLSCLSAQIPKPAELNSWNKNALPKTPEETGASLLNNPVSGASNTGSALNTAAVNPSNPGPKEQADPYVEDISPENLLHVIAQEWANELNRLKSKYLSPYRRKKEQRNECLVQSGHAEIEGDSMLFIYGNALEVLNNPDFQKTVEQICFQYVRFDNIVHASNLVKLKKFQKLKRLVFLDNFLHSFIQISKLESLPYLSSLAVENNTVANTILCRTFIVYRFPNITEINAKAVSESDKHKARKQFQHFDRILSTPSLISTKKKIMEKTSEGRQDDQHERAPSSKTQRVINKKNIEATQNFLLNVIGQSVINEKKTEELREHWDSALENVIYESVRELNTNECINEKLIRKIVNLS